jgi:hypothetical protein
MKQSIRRAISMTPEERKQAKIEAQRKQAASGVPRDARGRILPGYSLNSLGRPRTALSELCRAQITKHSLVAVLGSIAARSGDYAKKSKIPITVSDQINAIRLLLLYGYGMPKAELDNGDVKIEVTYADNRSVTIANAAPGAGEDHQGVQAIQRRLLRPEVRQDHVGSGPADSSCTTG